MGMPQLDRWLAERLVCPRDLKPVQVRGDRLVCLNRHEYPYVDGIPVMLLDEAIPAQREAQVTLEQVAHRPPSVAEEPLLCTGAIDQFVQQAIAATSGNLFRSSVNKLHRYPIPNIPLPPAPGKSFLDLGCNWGRWCLAAAQNGYRPVGIDHNLDAIRAARRVARQLGVTSHYLVADARHLPFLSGCFDAVFSYSVFQHLDKDDAKQSFREAGRILAPSGTCLIQMPNKFGFRNMGVQLMRGFRPGTGFEVRYWSPKELKETFHQLVGPTTLRVDGFFSLNPDARNAELLPPGGRMLVSCSESLRRLSQRFLWMIGVPDSLFVESRVGGREQTL